MVKTHGNTNLVASWCFKMKKTLLPVDVRRSKMPLLKLSNIVGTRKTDFALPFQCEKPREKLSEDKGQRHIVSLMW